MAGLTDAPFIQALAVPAVCLLIASLGIGSQLIFRIPSLEPGPLSGFQTAYINTLLLTIAYTYYKTVTVDPGRFAFPESGAPVLELDDAVNDEHGGALWCRKCEMPKPPRAHHCRHCGRCVPRMDHHCPWTANCVSMTTFPHFLRFLTWANIGLWALGHLLWFRLYALYERRNMPAYLGPSLPALIALVLLLFVCFLTTLVLGIMLVTTIRSWILNQTMIEDWEIERHDAVAHRVDRNISDILGPDGKKLRFERVEFPYDIGFFANMSQAMGTANVLAWFFPFAGQPNVGRYGQGPGWTWPENGFNRKTGMWPPLDPDKLCRATREWPTLRRDFEAELQRANLSPEERREAFKRRQDEDLCRRKLLVAELEELDEYDMMDDEDEDDIHIHDRNDDNDDSRRSIGSGPEHRPGWTNPYGERLRDYGVDEVDAEELPDDAAPDEDVPLAELLRRRRVPPRAETEP